MRLEQNILHVNEVSFADKTGIDRKVLYINREELSNLLKEDKRLADVDIELANPGEKCRIVRVADVIEPRAKLGNSPPDFPGVLGKQATAGEGITCVLNSSAVVVSEFTDANEIASPSQAGDIIDMWGPGAECSPYGMTANVVILPHPARETREDEYKIASKIAGLKTAVYLARAGVNLRPDEVQVYDLELTTSHANHSDFPELPRVCYIFQVLTNQYEPIPGDPVLYGDNIERIVPTILHPNEVLDGAVLIPYGRSFFVETYLIQNHPVIKELYRNHGSNLYFAGVIITNAPNNVPEYERAANVAANLAKHVLRADGAILTKTGGGAPELTMARTAQRCEELGIKTALALLHMGIDTTDISPKPSVIFNMPEVDAMVSMGAPTGNLNLAPVERVIGFPAHISDRSRVSGELTVQMRQVRGSMSQIGNSLLMAIRY